MRREVIVYPNNTACVDGRLLTQDESAALLKKHGIYDLRIAVDLKFRRGDCVFTIFTAPGLKRLDELTVALDDRKSAVRKQSGVIRKIKVKLKMRVKKTPKSKPVEVTQG